ncbi:MAG: carbamate kinase [Theionarchaea archaeon]|nr:MAG: carbamate kinase [Theionarchaea archaeon DG-70]MBU7011527.1 carbamate kinase [Theionarchaea archaeon]
MRMVIALGGNAIKKAREKGTAEQQLQNVRETFECLWELFKDHEIVITHGNGPQVGNILIQQESGEPYVPAMPLDICVAESQGLIGYMIQQSLQNMLRVHHIHKDIVTLITQVVVDEQDPAFQHPTKPVGPFYTPERAEELKGKGISVMEDAGRGYRRVVPSPDPICVLEADVITSLLEQGAIVIGAGGGGIPVGEKEGAREGKLCGIEAVVDKDLASEILAEAISADCFIILTDVEQVALNYGTQYQKNLAVLTVEEAETYLQEGHFAPGSMKPKVVAALRFLKAKGKRVIITSPQKASEALKGKAGTEIVF